MNKQKRTRFLGLGALILLIILSVALYNTVFSVTSYQECIENDQGDVLCFDMRSKTPVGAFDITSNAFGDQAVEPGDLVRVGIELDLQFGDTPIGFSTLIIYREDGSRKGAWQLHQILNERIDFFITSDTSKYVYSIVSFNADDEPGRFKVVSDVKAANGRVIDDDIKYFTVSAPDIECPDAESSNWVLFEAMQHGDVYKKAHTTYGDAPSCTQRITYEYKTDCDGGYHIEGSTKTLDVDDNAQVCVIDEVIIDEDEVIVIDPIVVEPVIDTPTDDGDASDEGVEVVTGTEKVGFFQAIWNWIKGIFSN